MLALMARIGRCRLDERVAPDAFSALARAVTAQQVSAKAARTVFGRLTALMPAAALSPVAVLALEPDVLCATGLGPTKTRCLRGLAERIQDGRLPMTRLSVMSNDAIVDALTDVPGIGRWTAEVFLMFQLGRLDVFPAGDLALQTAVQRVYRRRRRPTPAEARRFAERWRPFRSVACWYLWRTIEPAT